MYTLFTDTDTDITPEKAKEYGYNLISMPYVIDEKEIYPYVDFDTFDYHTFYQSLRDGTMPKTCGIDPQKYYDYFEPFFAQGQDVLYVHFSGAMSGTFNAMHIAEQMLAEKYPERKLYTVDTKGITICSYNIVCEIGEMYKQGKTAEEICEWAKTEVDHFAIYFMAEHLDFFRRSGRVGGLAAFVGGLIGLRPIMNMGEDGKMKSVDKATGRSSTFNKLVDYVTKLQDDITNHKVIIGHSDCLPLAQKFAEKLQQAFDGKLNIEFVVVNPTAGSHCGPDGIGVCFHAVHR